MFKDMLDWIFLTSWSLVTISLLQRLNKSSEKKNTGNLEETSGGSRKEVAEESPEGTMG